MSRHPRGQSSFRGAFLSRRSISKRHSALGIFPFHRRLRIEPLEDRRLLATITVDTLTDGIGVPGTSLREALAVANANDTVNFSVTGTINLTNLGHLVVNKSLTVSGPGADLLTISAFDPDVDGTNDGDGGRAFYISAPGLVNVTISGLTLANGDVNSSGGAIFNNENLSILDSVITGNAAMHASSRGGGIAHFNGALTLERTTISNNFAVVTGGGLSAEFATAVHVTGSTISGNQAASGGGIYGYYSYNMNVVGSTISGNQATLAGGGVGLFYSSLSARHSTISANRGDSDDNGLGGGGGAVVGSFSTLSLFHTIVASNFRGAGATRSDIFGAVTADFSLIGDNTNAIVTNVGGTSLVGTGAMPIDARLGSLASNGGRTQTHALLAGSPAIDSGQVGIVSPPASDQRGAPFVRIFDGDGAGGARIDMGAYERQALAASSFVVDTLIDEDDGIYSAGDRSLREAISLAHGSSGAETITFAAALTSGPATILLIRGELAIRDSFTIAGPGANLLTIDASGNDPAPDDDGDGSRVFNVDDGDNGLITGTFSNVSISGLTLSGGDTAFSGGGIRTLENLTVASSVVSGNSAASSGGGIYTAYGTLMLLNSTVRQNNAVFGGGIANYQGTAVVDRSTISSNRALVMYGGEGGGIHNNRGNFTVTSSTISGNISEDGGGIHSYTNLTGTQTTTIINSTISGNVATSQIANNAEGGGVYNDHGLTVIRHSTVTNNTAQPGLGSGVLSKADGTARTEVYSSIIAGNTNSDVDFVEGLDNSFQSNGFNLIGTGNALGDFNQSGDQTGVTNPMLGPLAPNGGQTNTHSLLAGSPAIDSGQLGIPSLPTNDQRGAPFVRISDGDGAGGARIDIGAYERQTLPGLNLIVDEVVDENDGDYSLGDLSLREAIGLANGNPGADAIAFDPALYAIKIAKIFLTQGELAITDPLTINGPGSENLLIDASRDDPTPYTRNADGIRVFRVDDGNAATAIDVHIIGVDIRGGDVAGKGGAIYSFEDLTIDDSEIISNHAENGGGVFVEIGEFSISHSTITGNTATNRGGGVCIFYAPATITDSTINDNVAEGNGGGVITYFPLTITRSTIVGNAADNGGGVSGNSLIINDSNVTGNTAVDAAGGVRSYGAVTITRSTISGNSAIEGGGIGGNASITVTDTTVSGNSATHGGGIRQINRNLNVNSSTISGNQAVEGGGIWTQLGYGYEANILNSTLSGNTATGNGSAVFNSFGNMTIRYSTITSNYAGFGVAAVASRSSATQLVVGSSIIASNGFGDDVQFIDGPVNPFTSLGYNLVGGGNAASAPTNAFTAPGDQVGALPMLGLLADNGGPTKTHMPLAGSPAIDAGNPFAVPGVGDVPFFDQRGVPFIRVFDGDTMGGPRMDIGAYEIQTVANLSLQVDTLADEYDGNFSTGDFSLREAIGLANGSAGPNTITFASSLTSGGPATISLSLGEFQIRETLTLTGPGATLLTIDVSASDPTPTQNNGDGSRVFDANDNLVGTGSVVFTISGLKLTGGDHHTEGGAIQSNESVVISNCVIIDNSAADGGGIFVDDGSLTMTNCTVIGNSARDDGGGIYQDDGLSVITASMIEGNTAADRGGGIANFENLELVVSLVSGNSAVFGGGIFSRTNLSGYFTHIRNSTISGNMASSRGGGVYSYRGLTTIRFSTVTDNNSPAGMGSGVASRGDSLTRTEVHSSIIAGNDNSDVDYVNGGANSFDSEGYNLIGTGNATQSPINAFNQTGDQVGANPLLGPLTSNGGPTMTHAILVGSPAIDAGNPAAVAGLNGVPVTDQRGSSFGRVFDGNGVGGARIDIGAFERQPIPAAVFGDYNRDGSADAADYVIWRKTLGTTAVPTYSGADGDGDTTIDQDDYDVWQTNFGMTVPAPGAGSAGGVPSFNTPEIRISEPSMLLSTKSTSASAEMDLAAARAPGFAALDHPARRQDSGSRSRGRLQRFGLAESGSDDLLLLAIDRTEHSSPQDVAGADYREMDDLNAHDWERKWLIDESPTTALAEWRSAWGNTGVVRR